MAEGWARQLTADTIEAYSAGIETHGLNPSAVKVMAEAGVDITSQKSQHVDELKHVELDYVVTVCDNAAESCPVFSGSAKVIHHSFDDPPRLAREAATEEEGMAHYRRVSGARCCWEPCLLLPSAPTSVALFFGNVMASVNAGSTITLPLLYGVGTAILVIIFAALIALGSQALGKAFKAVSKIEWWARMGIGWMILLVGVWLTVQALLS